jgi:hypothetical protein
MKTFETSTTINAPAETVWALLTDAAGYPAWNTTVDKVEGRIALRERIKVHAKISPGRAFPVTVIELVPAERMVWSNKMPLGLFKGERTFTLKRQGNAVEFSMREVFSGLLSPMIAKSIPDLKPDFDAFAASLKRRAESAK